MIILSLIMLLISTFLQGLLSNYLGYTFDNLSIFSTIYILITLLIINPNFENKKKYFFLLIIFGTIMDVAYTNTFGLNISLFIVCYYISQAFHFFFPYNPFTISISNLLCISIYHVGSFILLSMFKYDMYPISSLSNILLNSILMTIIYSTLMYFVINLFVKRLQLKEVK